MKVEAPKQCIDYLWSTLTCNRALSNGLGLPVLSISPDSGDEFAVLLSNPTLYPRYEACDNSVTLNLFHLYLQITRVMVILDQISIVPVVVLHNRSVQVNVPKVPKFINKRLHFPKSKHYTQFYLLCQLGDYF